MGRDLSPRPQAWLQAVTWHSSPARQPRPPGPRCAGVARCSWQGERARLRLGGQKAGEPGGLQASEGLGQARGPPGFGLGAVRKQGSFCNRVS